MSRFATRFAAIFEKDDGTAWEARHGIDGNTYQATFDSLVRQGFCLTYVDGYSQGQEARFNAIWQKRGGPAWQARHGMISDQYQAAFDSLAQQGFRLVTVSGYAENVRRDTPPSGNNANGLLGRHATECHVCNISRRSTT
jgi:hypothetical protein